MTRIMLQVYIIKENLAFYTVCNKAALYNSPMKYFCFFTTFATTFSRVFFLIIHRLRHCKNPYYPSKRQALSQNLWY